ncbi:hypothetical protein EI040_25010, partial [Escherichia coli]|nr:hypothetical protein [Escherichia coli]
ETLKKKKEKTEQDIKLKEKENMYSKFKERFEIEQQEKQKRQKLLRTTFILLTLVGIGLTAFSFISNNMLFGIIFAVLTLVFVIGIIMSKSKEVDYSEAITDEIEEIKAQ